MKYLAQVTILHNGTNQGCFRFNSDSLDEIRSWALSVGVAGDTLLIVPNGKPLSSGRTFTL